MSGICGIYHLDGQPVNRNALTAMTETVRHRGPDGVSLHIDPSIGMGHTALHTKPESPREAQPFHDLTGERILVFDGRIDNREELIEVFGLKQPKTVTDTDLIMIGHEKWGQGFPSRIIGDFALALWDGRKRTLLCARDPVGVKPFYYFFDGKVFLWGSEPKCILSQLPHRPEAEEAMVAEFLALTMANKEQTFFKGILRLPPAHVVTVRPGGLDKRRYWEFDPGLQFKYRDDDQYGDHFEQILSEAVRCRSRSPGKVGIHLSGGLDSSSVVATASALNKRNRLDSLGVETFSMAFPGLDCDEVRFADAVTGRCNVDANVCTMQMPETSCYVEQAARYDDVPDYPSHTMLYPTNRLLVNKGMRTLLTGLGGDDWFQGSNYLYADLIRDMRLVTLWRRIRRDPAAARISPLRSNPVVARGIWPNMPRWLRNGVRKINKPGAWLPEWIEEDFLQRTNLGERLHLDTDWTRFSTFSQGRGYLSATNGWQLHTLEITDRSAASFGMEWRHPYHDRRLIEFALAIPEEQKYRHGYRKWVIRNAMKQHLPESVWRRSDKVSFTQVFASEVLKFENRGIFEDLKSASIGWVRQDKVDELLGNARPGCSSTFYPRNLMYLWQIIAVELWLSHV